MKKKILTVLSLALTVMMLFGIASCGGKHTIESNTADPERTFTYFIPKQDGVGVGGSYDSYDQNPSVLYLTKDPYQYKSATKQGNSYVQGGEVSNNVALRFTSSTVGNEKTDFITNLNNDVDILDMNYATETAQTMYSKGKLLDLTYWVENYMPNYLAVAKKYGIDNLISTHVNGEKKYLQIYSVYENVNWQYYGFQYRKDWLLNYGKTFNTETGAIGSQTFKEANPSWGWNGSGTDRQWTDGIVFPSYYGLQYTSDGSALGTGTLTYNKELYDYIRGEYTTYSQNRANEVETTLSAVQRDFDTYHGQWPATISDWEWMLDIFQIAVNDLFKDGRGYCMNIYQAGYVATGNLISSFGGTGGEWQKTADQQSVAFGPDSSAFKTYVDTMHKWWENGWIDEEFQTHSDLLWRTDESNVRQGYAGLYFGMNDQLFGGMDIGAGNTKDIYVDGMPYPINDKYGSAENKYQIPTTLYAANFETDSIMVSSAAEKNGKDLAALFTMLDAAFTDKMGAAKSWGLTSEMLAESQDGVKELYKKLGYPEGTVKYNAETKSYYRHENALDVLMDDQYVVSSRRLVGLEGSVLGYEQKANDQYENYLWNFFPDKGFLTKSFYANLNNAQYSLYTDKVGQLRSKLSAEIPKFIKGASGYDMSAYDQWYGKLKNDLLLDDITGMLNNQWKTLNAN